MIVKSQADLIKGLECVQGILEVLGEDPRREGLRDTPKRVVKSWEELFSGYFTNPRNVLGTTFDAGGYDQLVLLKDIEFFSTCEHHMLSFFGKAHVGYVPGKRVVGLSKLARLVEAFSRRLQIQERLTQQIADTLEEVLEPKGVMVVLQAKHMCMVARGVSKQHSEMTTSAIKGCLDDVAARQEFLALIGS